MSEITRSICPCRLQPRLQPQQSQAKKDITQQHKSMPSQGLGTNVAWCAWWMTSQPSLNVLSHHFCRHSIPCGSSCGLQLITTWPRAGVGQAVLALFCTIPRRKNNVEKNGDNFAITRGCRRVVIFEWYLPGIIYLKSRCLHLVDNDSFLFCRHIHANAWCAVQIMTF